MTYHIEYHTPGSLTRGKEGEDLTALLMAIKKEGCRISLMDCNAASIWSETAESGDRYHLGCVCTITKGEREMTEYTSF